MSPWYIQTTRERGEFLAKSEQTSWRQRLQRAYTRPAYEEALGALEKLHGELDDRNRSAEGDGFRHLPTLRAALKRDLEIDTTTSKTHAASAGRSRGEFQPKTSLTRSEAPLIYWLSLVFRCECVRAESEGVVGFAGRITMCGRTAACVCITCLLPIASVAHAANDARLAEAVKQRDREAVHALLGDKADVNAPLGDGATALHWAAQWDDLETADLLIRAGARVNATDDYGVTPLWLASTNGNAHIVEKLLQAGADPNATLPTGATVLMTASRTGKADAVQLLLEHGAAVSATEHAHGQTALMWAAAEGHAEAARALIAHGADVHAQSTAGYTPLLLSARNRSLDAARVLLDAGADVNQAAPDGTTALVVATIRSRTTLARFLLEHGADANAGPGFTPLHWAAGEWNQQVTGRMGLRDEDSEWSITGGLRGEAQLEFVKVLLSHGANPNARATSNPRVVGPRPQSKPRVVRPRPGRTSRRGETTAGATPFWIAAKVGDVDVMRLLLVSGADPSLANRSVTPLMAAAGVGAGTGSSPVPQSRALEAVKLCLALGNDINATTDENGETALHGAAYRGPQGTDLLIQFLVDNGASMNVKNALGWTPLTIVEGLYFTATNTYSASGAELLRTLGADPSPANIDRQVGTTVGPTRANR